VAKAFDEDVKAIVHQHLAKLSNFPVSMDDVYEMELILYFDRLENPGWFEKWDTNKYYTKDIIPKRRKTPLHKKGDLKARAGERKAKTRYKIIDYDNRIKYLQDCVAKIVGIPDDSQIFRVLGEKREGGNPRAEVRIRVLNRDEFFPERR
jgi:hypothetical protein